MASCGVGVVLFFFIVSTFSHSLMMRQLVALLKEVGEAGQHDDFTEDVGFGVITVAKGMTSRSRQAAYIE
ncbi:hypothetical protein ACTZH6_25880 (plasmid) [Escherichia coli]|nr:hypothetical protein [Escherichia coli]HAI6208903.1 hypothetical protein [Escherichia coli]